MQENRRGLKRSTVVILIISLVLMLGGAAMAVTGIALGGLQQLDGVTINGHPINISGNAEPLENATVDVNAFENIDIEANGSQISFVNDDTYYVESTYAPNCEPLIDVQDGTLYVRDWAAMEGGKVGFVNNKDGSKGIFVTDGSGNNVKLDGEGIKVTDEDGGQVTINGLGIHIEGEDGSDIQVGSPDDPFTIDLTGIYNEGYYEYPSIVVHCPMDKQYKVVSLQSGWTESDFDGLKAETLTLGIDSTTLNFKNSEIGALTGRTDYADLSFDTCKLGAVELSGSGLTVGMKDTEATGDITLNASNSMDEFGMSGCTVGGNLNVQTESLSGSIKNCTIAGDANIESEYGSMEIQNSTMDNLDVEGESVSLKVNGSTVKKDVVVDVEQYGDEMVVSNSTCGTFTVNGESIALNMSDTTVNKTLTAKASYGTIDMGNVTADGLTAKVNDGEISFTGTLTGKSEIATESGDINILIRGDKKDYAYALNSQDGEVMVDGAPFKATVGQDKAPNTIQVDSETGGITLAFQK